MRTKEQMEKFLAVMVYVCVDYPSACPSTFGLKDAEWCKGRWNALSCYECVKAACTEYHKEISGS